MSAISKLGQFFFVSLFLTCTFVASVSSADPLNLFKKRYVFYIGDLRDSAHVARLSSIIDRAANAGYNGIVIREKNESFQIDPPDPLLKTNLEALITKATGLGMELIPSHLGQTEYTRGHFSEVAEVVPVKDATFLVQKNSLSTKVVPNASFESWGLFSKELPFDMTVDAPGVISFRDSSTKHSGTNSIRFTNPSLDPVSGAARLRTEILALDPTSTYKLSFWLKTLNISDPNKFVARIRSYDQFDQNPIVLLDDSTFQAGIAGTQDWKQYSISFSTTDRFRTEITLGLVNKAETGSFWLDDLNLTTISSAVAAVENIAVPVHDTSVTCSNAGFESWESSSANTPQGYYVDGPGVVVFRDTAVKHFGTSSVRLQDSYKNSPYGMARVHSPMTRVKPFQSYRLSFWLKTEGLSGNADGLNWLVDAYNESENVSTRLYTTRERQGPGFEVASTQNWRKYEFVFNNLNYPKVRLFLGIWDPAGHGKAWVDDIEIKETELENAIRRDGMEVTVKSASGTTTYKQGTDLLLQGDNLLIPASSAIRAGNTIKVSWYRLGKMMGTGIPGSACRNVFYDARTQGVKNLNILFKQPRSFMIGYDEWRIGNWDPACTALNGGTAMTGGRYLAYAMQKTEDLVRQNLPGANILVWNDMFDPYHNAQPVYHAFNGSLANSWDGVSPSTIIMNWNSDNAIDPQSNQPKGQASLKFFAQRGHKQIIAGYYDDPNNVQWWLDSLNKLETQSNLSGIEGFMYTTWVKGADGGIGEYKDLEAVADKVRLSGRWKSPPKPQAPKNPKVTGVE